MPPMNQGPLGKGQNEKTNGRVGEYLKKVATELEKQFEEVPKKEVPQKVTKPMEKVQQQLNELKQEGRAQLENNRSNRPTLEENGRSSRSSFDYSKKIQVNDKPLEVQVKVGSARSAFLPSTKKGMAQAIIMSEILAPPISKRRR